MVNEEDHLRLQVIRSGLQLDEAYEEIDRMDTALEGSLNFAFSPQFGYLTACPTNVGTGLRISVMMHLPAAALSKQMEKVLQSLQRLNYTVRGFYGEGTQPLGDFYQVSNQITMGKSERDIISELKKVIPEILKFERSWRHKLIDDEPRKLEDRVWRAYGILKHARRITSEEATDLLSALRLTRKPGGRLNKTRAALYLGWDPDTLVARMQDARIGDDLAESSDEEGWRVEAPRDLDDEEDAASAPKSPAQLSERSVEPARSAAAAAEEEGPRALHDAHGP